MAATAAPDFGAGRLLVADSRLALILLNEGRHWMLRRYFGVSRQQANLASVLVALTAADVAYATTRRLLRAPLGIDRTDAALGWFVVRDASLRIAGPADRGVPLAATLVTLAAAGGAALPALRRAAHSARAAERRVRLDRIRRYVAAGTPSATA
jgi:hypothetical protein